MYKIFCDGEAIHDPSLDSPERLVYGATLTQQANMADSFSFTVYPNNPGAARIYKLVSTVEVYQDNELLFRGRPIQSTTGWDNQETITCEGGLAILNDTILRPYEYTGTVRGYLQMLVTQHNEQVPDDKRFLLRSVTVTDPNDNITRSNGDYVSTMQEIQDKLVNNLGGYLVVTYNGGWILDYLAISTEASGQTITLAKNLLDIIREQNAQNIATALIPLGANDEQTGQRITIESVNGGLDYIVDQTAASQYGLIFATEIWDDVTVPANLLTKARAKLSDYATLIPTIELTAVDLSLTDQAIDPIRILDNITVEDDQHQASGRYLVTQRTYNLSDPSADAVTFGGTLPTITGIATRTSSELQEVPQRILKNASDRARALLEDATDGAIEILYNDDGVAYELRINNSQTPSAATSYWRYNRSGWGYYDAITDTYKTAATMDGAIFATLITAGILQSDDGQTFYLDLDNGILKGNFSELKISGSTAASQSYADGKASTAQSNAISAAAQDATQKAEAAKTAAINAAATDATNKANAAEAAAEAEAAVLASAAREAAIAAAATDAANKVDAYNTYLTQQVVFNKLTNNGQEQGIYLSNGKVYINGSYIKANSISADLINGGTITSSTINVIGATTTDGKVSVEYTTQGRTYKSILKPAMLVNSYTYSGSTEEADVRYDRLQFVAGSTELSSYEDVAATIKSTNGSYITILPPSASGKYITIQPVVVSTW